MSNEVYEDNYPAFETHRNRTQCNHKRDSVNPESYGNRKSESQVKSITSVGGRYFFTRIALTEDRTPSAKVF